LIFVSLFADRLNDLWKYDGEEWVWESGSKAPNEIGVYGEKGVPNPNNIPGGREGAVSWMDNSGNMWLFGGYRYPISSDSSGNAIHLDYYE
jgi:hypothetical protein